MDGTWDISQYPQEEAVEKISRMLREILFFQDPQKEAEWKRILLEQLTRICGREHAESLLEGFWGQIPQLRQVLEKDLQAAFDGDPAAQSKEEILLSYPGFFAVTVYRAAHYFQEQGVKILPRMMTEFVHSRTGIDIHPGAQIGEGFFMDHGTGIVIGETTVIGKNVKLYQGVTLGALSTRGGQRLKGVKRHPTIEDGVTVYAGATILGGATVIGMGNVIGANAFITSSVPAR